MKRDMENEAPRARNLSRREVIGFIGASAAASLVGHARERSTSAELTSTPNQKKEVRMARINARPDPIVIDMGKTAVIVVDMQNDFGSEGGLMQRAGYDLSMIRAAIPPTVRSLSAARAAGLKVIYLKMAFQPDMSDAGPLDSPNHVRHVKAGAGTSVRAPNGTDSRILIRDTWNTDIVTELAPNADDVVLYKHRFSGFYETDLDAILKRSGAKYLVFVGWTMSTCVESTIRDAMFRDYSCVLLSDCTGEPIGAGVLKCNDDTLLRIQFLGWLSDSDEFIRAIKSHSA
jgi:ureidoacrylate peracid hydrolase